MKHFSTLIFCLFFSSIIFAQVPDKAKTWGIKFQDDFEGNTLDATKWKLGLHWLGNTGLAGTNPQNFSVANGKLKIIAKKQPIIFGGKTYAYSAGEISTFQNFKVKYGYFEARMKYDAIKGIWPAFWTMPDSGDYGNPKDNQMGLVNFDLNGITSVNTATLKLRVKEMPNGGTKSITVHKLLDLNWDENEVTWNSKPNFDPIYIQQLTGSGDASLTSQLIVGSYVTIDVTDYINEQIIANKNAGFALIDNFMRAATVEFGSREGAAEDRPILNIDGNSIEASSDAFVKGGTSANSNYGAKKYLRVSQPWMKTSSTSNGAMEFDIMEALGVWGAGKAQNALHWDDYGPDHKTVHSPKHTVIPTDDGFHTYGMLWEQGNVEFYIDGEKVWTHTDTRIGEIPSYLILSMQMGGWDGNSSPSDNLLPGSLEVDYVKVYHPSVVANNNIESKQFELAISPNPVHDFIGLTLSTKTNISAVDYFISDLLGHNIFQSVIKLDSQETTILNIPIDNLNLKKGIYFLTVGGSTTKFEKL